jgi:hypothetical protein
MLFELPFVYKVTGVKRGNRRATTYDVVEMVEVDIAVVDEMDAPVAVEWIASIPEALQIQSTIGDLGAGFSPVPPDGRLHTRLIGDRHFCPVIGIDLPGWTGPLVDPALLNETRGVGIWRDIFHLKPLPSGPFRGGENLAGKGLLPVESLNDAFEMIERTTRERALADLRKSISDCAFVANTLYHVCSEPRIVYAYVNVRDARGVWQRGAIPFVTCDPDHAANFLDTSMISYSVHDLGRWKSLVRKSNGVNTCRDLFAPLYVGRAPIVKNVMADPDYQFRRKIDRRMRDFLSHCGACPLRDLTTPVIEAYCGIVDINECVGEPGGLDALEGALSIFVELARIGNARENALSQYVDDILEMLASRPVEIVASVQQCVRRA